jgi:hypothetical protein
MRASSVVKCHWIGAARVLRCFCQAVTSARMVLRLGIRRDKHWPLSALSSISAMLSQLPCLVVSVRPGTSYPTDERWDRMSQWQL